MNALAATLQGFQQGYGVAIQQKERKRQKAFQNQLETLLGGGSPTGAPVGTPGIVPNQSAPNQLQQAMGGQSQSPANPLQQAAGPDYGAISQLYARNGDPQGAMAYYKMQQAQREQGVAQQKAAQSAQQKESQVLYSIGKGVLDGKYTLDQAKAFLVQNGADPQELSQITEQTLPQQVALLEAQLSQMGVLKDNEAVYNQLTGQIITSNRGPEKLGQGDQLVTAQGGLLAKNEATPDLPPGMRMGANGQPEYIPGYLEGQERLRAAGRTSVNLNTGESTPEIGTIPKGYQAVRGPDGNYSMAPVKGGPADPGSEMYKSKATASRSMMNRTTNTTVSAIDRALQIASPFSTGTGSLLSVIPGTQAANLKAELETIRANVAFNRLNEMRNASPTGGALGQITERELDLLAAVEGALDTGQSPAQFIENMQRVRENLQQVQQDRERMYQQMFGSQGSTPETKVDANSPLVQNSDGTFDWKPQ